MTIDNITLKLLWNCLIQVLLTCWGSSSMPGFSRSSRCASGFSFHSSSRRLICWAEIWRARSCSASDGTLTSHGRNWRSWINGCHCVGSQFMSWYNKTDLFATKYARTFPFSAFRPLVERQKGHPAWKKTGCWFIGGEDGLVHRLPGEKKSLVDNGSRRSRRHTGWRHQMSCTAQQIPVIGRGRPSLTASISDSVINSVSDYQYVSCKNPYLNPTEVSHTLKFCEAWTRANVQNSA